MVDRKSQIIHTAARLFSRHGYHNTSVRDIARELDLQGGSLYSHIDGKEAVLWDILDRAADEFLHTIRPIAMADAAPAEKLRAAIHAHVGVITDDLAAATVYFHEWRFLSEPRRSEFLTRRNEYEDSMRGIVEEGIAAGEFQNVDPKFATLLILSAVNWIYQWYRPDGALSPDEIADRFIGLLFSGLETEKVAADATRGIV